jgi:hypothetical protein
MSRSVFEQLLNLVQPVLMNQTHRKRKLPKNYEEYDRDVDPYVSLAFTLRWLAGAQRWDLERQVRLVAGSIVALSVLASIFVPGFKWVALFIGSGLVFAAVSNTCMMGMLLAKLPYNRGATCDAQTIVGQLVDSRSAQPGSR